MRKDSGALSVGFLFDDTLDSSDGVAQYVKNLGAWLSQRGHQVSYLVGQSKGEKRAGGKVYSLSRNLPVRWGGNNLSIPLWPRLQKINRVLAENRFDILHVQVPYSPLMSQIVLKKIPLDTAVLGSFHVYPSSQLAIIGSKLLKFVYGKSLRRFDWWLSVSPAAADYAKQAFKIDSQISPNVVWLDRFQAAKNSPRPNHIVFLGRLVKRKGAMQLLEAFKLLHAEMPNVALTIASDGPLRSKLEKFVFNNGLVKSVKFTGRISEADKPALLASAQIACFPSLYGESFGIVLIEAMAAGAGVVIGGDNPGYRTVLQNRQTLVKPADSVAFAKTLKEFLSNKMYLDKHHAWQQQRVKDFDIKKIGPQIEGAYRRAIAQNRRSRHN